MKLEEKIGGKRTIVKIDESNFGKRKCSVGRIVEGQLMFRGACARHEPAS